MCLFCSLLLFYLVAVICEPILILCIYSPIRQLKFEEMKKKAERADKTSKSNAYFVDAWEAITQPIVQAVMPAVNKKFWEDLSPRIYVSFWTLTMYDLEVPKDIYNQQDERLKAQIAAIEEDRTMTPAKIKKEAERGRMMQLKLIEEQLKQDEHVRRVRGRLEQEKEHWFQSSKLLARVNSLLIFICLVDSVKSEMTTQFFQHCLFPRCLFTASDALYCAKFVHLLHTLKTPNFSTLICFDRVSSLIS